MGMYLGGQKISPIIKVGAEINNQDKTITENGTYTADAGYTGLGEVVVNVPSEQPVITQLNVTPTTSAQTIVAPSGTDGYSPVNVSAVTSSIDSNIIAGNIKKDVQILGVTGTYEGSGGGGDSGGKYLVQVIDYDGTVLKQDHLDAGATFTLPSQPSHTGLIFQSWSSPVTITNNTVTVTNSDITIGAIYTTASGLSEFDISLTTVTGLSVTLNMVGTKDWGDGISDTETSHTYAQEGSYTITCDGSIMTTSIFGQSSSTINYYVKDIRLGNNVTNINDQAFYQCYSLTSVTIPSRVTWIGEGAFDGCHSLTNITIPEGVRNIDDRAFYQCYSLTNITIPEGVRSISGYAFHQCYSLTSITIPSSVTSIGDRAFYQCHSLTNITIPSSVTSIGGNVFMHCYSLTSIIIPSSVTSINTQVLYNCYSLTSIIIPSSVTSISDRAFYQCYSILEYDFSSHMAVPTLASTLAFTGINQICKIKVPASLEAEWKVATNWSTYADYIVGV